MDIAKEAAKLFSPPPWKHKQYQCWNDPPVWRCRKCLLEETGHQKMATPCPIPDPIDITDWNVAMRLIREVTHCSVGMVDVYNKRCNKSYRWDDDPERTVAMAWFASPLSTPQDYIEAACITRAKENYNGHKNT